ncbi:MAG: hypothetical protein NWS55_08770 [Solirubrobacteraceae bacterium]|nr:hypothetical protein [Solirubrobacteraceae bacterium]MDP4673690.1 hypothetical protein [Solirubrobacteraceae bacterium]
MTDTAASSIIARLEAIGVWPYPHRVLIALTGLIAAVLILFGQ